MAYTNGSQGANANCAQTFMATLDTILTGNGFTFIEEVTSGNITARVYKSPVAGNGVMDWYLVVRRTSNSATSVNFYVSEDYDATNHVLLKYAPSSSTANTATVDYAINDPAGKNPTGTSGIGVQSVTIATSAFSYWVSVTAKRVIIATRTASDYAVYLGLYDDFLPAGWQVDNVVVMDHRVVSSSTSAGSSTREPGFTGGSTVNFQVLFPGGNSGVGSGTDPYTNKLTVHRVRVNGSRGPSFEFRGLSKDVLYGAQAGMVNGDTLNVEINGSTVAYVAMGSGATHGMWVNTTA